MEQLNIEVLKEDLINYFATAINPVDVDLLNVNIENLSDDKLIELAKKNGLNVDNYIIKKEQ